jgi:23S rRNA (cytidine1920-2'-O)/16S rRNA (cytidine1409-2'-O)-methyltransferase
MKERLDQMLIQKNLAPTRSQAQLLIKEGVVFLNGQQVTKASLKCSELDTIEVHKDHLWVGRGAEKLAGAYDDFSLSFEEKVIGDMGASTGGFVEFALFHGAKKVFAVDVGRDQLAPSLRENSKVINLEGINIKEGLTLDEQCDLIVIDLSFISLGEMVVLVKPQFEVGKEFIGKKGIVKSQEATLGCLEKIYDFLENQDCRVLNVAPCRVKGKTGNQEYFYHCVYEGPRSGYSRSQLTKLIS